MSQGNPKTAVDAIRMVNEPENPNLQDALQVNQPHFGSLLSDEVLSELSINDLLAVDITKELQALHEDGYFEVQLPVLGYTDFLGSGVVGGQNFPTVVAINGFGAKASGSDGSFPRPDFFLVEDILGNEFEVIVGPDGKIETPVDGTGKFSVINKLSFYFSSDQVLDGSGLAPLATDGIEKHHLYLLPPQHANGVVTPTIVISHLDELNHKVVDLVRETPFLMQESNFVSKLSVDFVPDEARIDFTIQHSSAYVPFDLGLRINYDNMSPLATGVKSNAWLQSKFELQAPLGLSEDGLRKVSKDLFNDYDFTKALLEGDNFELDAKNDFNDFLLRPDARETFYDHWIEALVGKTLPGDALLTRIPLERLHEVDSQQLGLSDADSAIVASMAEQANHNNWDLLKQQFLGENEIISQIQLPLGSAEDFNDLHFETSFEALGSLGPNLSVVGDSSFEAPLDFSNFFPESSLLASDFKLNSGSEHSAHFLGGLNGGMDLSSTDVASTIHYTDALSNTDTITGFDVSKDKLDISHLLESLGEAVNIEAKGNDVAVSITDNGGQVHQVAVLVDANQGNLSQNDLNGIVDLY